MTDATFPNFERPPVTEVVGGVAFRELRVTSADLIRFWQEAGEELGLTGVEEHPPYSPPIERFDVVPAGSITFGVSDQPPTPRFWFVSGDGTELVQVQRDWFACNWRKVRTGDDYARWPARREAFEKAFRAFFDFLGGRGVPPIEPLQCEVTYINHIQRMEGVWEHPGQFDRVLRIAGAGGQSFLPEAEGTEVKTTYVIRDKSNDPVGRLHITAQPAFSRVTMEPILLLNLTARCRPPGKDVEGVARGLDLGREWIVKAFVDITTEEAQRGWGRLADR